MLLILIHLSNFKRFSIKKWHKLGDKIEWILGKFCGLLLMVFGGGTSENKFLKKNKIESPNQSFCLYLSIFIQCLIITLTSRPSCKHWLYLKGKKYKRWSIKWSHLSSAHKLAKSSQIWQKLKFSNVNSGSNKQTLYDGNN